MTIGELEKKLQKEYPRATEHDIEEIINIIIFKQKLVKLLNQK